jgi:hypothetical protein
MRNKERKIFASRRELKYIMLPQLGVFRACQVGEGNIMKYPESFTNAANTSSV